MYGKRGKSTTRRKRFWRRRPLFASCRTANACRNSRTEFPPSSLARAGRVAAVDHAAAGQALCSAAEPRPRRRASITGITTRNGFCRSCRAPLHKSLRCYLLPGRFAELLSALVAKITMTFWPNAVAVPKVHPREAWTVWASCLGCGDDGAATAHPCTRWWG